MVITYYQAYQCDCCRSKYSEKKNVQNGWYCTISDFDILLHNIDYKCTRRNKNFKVCQHFWPYVSYSIAQYKNHIDQPQWMFGIVGNYKTIDSFKPILRYYQLIPWTMYWSLTTCIHPKKTMKQSHTIKVDNWSCILQSVSASISPASSANWLDDQLNQVFWHPICQLERLDWMLKYSYIWYGWYKFSIARWLACLRVYSISFITIMIG